MSEGGVQMTSETKRRVLGHGGICTAIFGVLSIAAVFSSKIQWGFFGYVALFVSGAVLTTIGVVVGDVLALLQEGFESDPPHTTSTRPADLESGTWYRFD